MQTAIGFLILYLVFPKVTCTFAIVFVAIQLVDFLPKSLGSAPTKDLVTYEQKRIETFLRSIKHRYVPDTGYACSFDHESMIVTWDRTFYAKLNQFERYAVLMHECGHWYFGDQDGFDNRVLDHELRADNFAAKHAGTAALISALKKSDIEPDDELKLRICRLQKFKPA